MNFDLRRVGNSRGIIIPKGFIDMFSQDGGKTIEMHFDMVPRDQEMVRGAAAIEPPENFEEGAEYVESMDLEEEIRKGGGVESMALEVKKVDLNKKAFIDMTKKEQVEFLRDKRHLGMSESEYYQICKKHKGYKGRCKCK